jgi:hypothetical protein
MNEISRLQKSDNMNIAVILYGGELVSSSVYDFAPCSDLSSPEQFLLSRLRN